MSYLIVDLETLAAECAVEFVEKPDLDAIQAPANYKDPVKIAEAVAAKRAEALEGYQQSLGRAALDWNLSRIVALGFHVNGHPEAECALLRTEQEEADALKMFWRLAQGRKLVGFCARTFDVPTLIQRSRILGVPCPRVSLAKYGRGDVLDVRDELTFDDARYEAIMPRSLKAFASRFGIPHMDPATGKDVAQMVAADDWEGVRAHCLSDVDMTRELAIRIGCMPTWKAVAA